MCPVASPPIPRPWEPPCILGHEIPLQKPRFVTPRGLLLFWSMSLSFIPYSHAPTVRDVRLRPGSPRSPPEPPTALVLGTAGVC